MYSRAVADDRLNTLLKSPLGAAVDGKVERLPVEQCLQLTRQLAAALDPKKGLTRQLSVDEQWFIRNERVLTKIDYRHWAERYCNPPEAPIWMGDLSFRPIAEVRPGDSVIGWAPPAQRNQWNREKLTRTKVLATQRRRSPLVSVHLESGTVVRCTPDHYWSNGRRKARVDGNLWVQPKVGKYLSRVVSLVDDPEDEDVRTAAWLGGLYDGEGTGTFIAQYETHNPEVFARIAEAGAALGFHLQPKADRTGFVLNGGRQEYLRFLLWTQPVRAERLAQRVLATRFRTPDRIVAVEPDGEGEVVSMQTETGNYVAWGYASKNCMIIRPDKGVSPMFPLWESQELILQALAEEEEARYARGHPDGLVFNILKGRQLGASTFCQSAIAHRGTTQSYTKGMIASDVPENSGSTGLFGMLELSVEHLPWWLKPQEKFHTKNQHIIWSNHSSVVVEAGKSMKGGLQDEGGQKGQLGRSKTYTCVHLSELSTWEYADTIDDSLDPAIARTQRTFWAKESTAKGRHNWWHNEWVATERGYGRSFNIFIPWYAEKSKYWLPTPDGWEPPGYCLEYAERVNRHAPRWMRRSFTLSKEQLYWYYSQYEAAKQKGVLYKFFEEYPAEPEEAFQYSGRSIFTPEQIDKLRNVARPLRTLYLVQPASLITEFRDQAFAEAQVHKETVAARQGPIVVKRRVGDPANPEPVDNSPQPPAEVLS